MRLWHQRLIPLLPDSKTSKDPKLNQLGGQHRECCAMRGGGWGKKHETVDYVWEHPKYFLEAYHLIVICELLSRGYRIDPKWLHVEDEARRLWTESYTKGRIIYPEHNENYFIECALNLAGKDIFVLNKDSKNY